MIKLSEGEYIISLVPADACCPTASSLSCCYCGKILPIRRLPICGQSSYCQCPYCGKVLEVTNIVRVHDWEVKRNG